MLFDLRGRGRRRTVQVIYVGLALLIGSGLVFFGVGAGVGGGGILDSLTGNEGSNSASFAGQIKKYKKLTQQQPSNVHAWEQLTLAQLHEAGGEAYVTRAGLTSKGKELFTQIAQSWSSYIALNPPKPSPELALQMERVYGEEGLNQPAEAVKVLQIIIPTKSDSPPQYQASLYAALAQYAYKSHNVRVGDLASGKAVALSPAAQRKRLKTQLAEVKKNPSGSNNGGAVITKGANGTYTATSKGKTYPVTPGPHGTYEGTAPPASTTAPGGLPTPPPSKK
jgi:hypothetical protein